MGPIRQMMATLKGLIWSLLDMIPDEYRPQLRRILGSSRTAMQAATHVQPITQARRVVWLRPEVADIEPLLLRGPAANELLVRVEASVISPGTERAFLLGLPNTGQTFPSGAGYAGAGQVIKVGKAVGDWAPGDRFAGVVPHVSHAVARPDRVVHSPPGLAPSHAAFGQLGAIAMHGTRRAEIEVGERVTVIGLGLIGQLVIQIARWAGGTPVVGMARSSAFAKLAFQSGCDEVVALDEDPGPSLALADVVIEATGNPDAITTALAATRDGGRVILVGSPRGVTPDFDFETAVRGRGITVIGAHINGVAEHESSVNLWTRRDETRLFLDLVDSGHIGLDHLISDVENPANANSVYERLVSSPRAMGIVFDWHRLEQEESP